MCGPEEKKRTEDMLAAESVEKIRKLIAERSPAGVSIGGELNGYSHVIRMH